MSDGYLRAWVSMPNGITGPKVVGVITVWPGEVDVLLDEEAPGARWSTSAVDEVALQDLQSRCLGGGVGRTGAVTDGPRQARKG